MDNKTSSQHISTNDLLLALIHEKRNSNISIIICLVIFTIFTILSNVFPLGVTIPYSTCLLILLICGTLLSVRTTIFNAILLLAAQLAVQNVSTEKTINNLRPLIKSIHSDINKTEDDLK